MSDSARREVAESGREVLWYFLTRGARRGGPGARGADRRAAAHPDGPSGTSLLGLIRHLTGVEEDWFQRVLRGQDHDTGTSMTVPPGAASDQAAARRPACARRDEIVRGCPDLSAVATIANPGVPHPVSLRPIVRHMIEETARHAGHAGTLPEQIDGAAGR